MSWDEGFTVVAGTDEVTGDLAVLKCPRCGEGVAPIGGGESLAQLRVTADHHWYDCSNR